MRTSREILSGFQLPLFTWRKYPSLVHIPLCKKCRTPYVSYNSIIIRCYSGINPAGTRNHFSKLILIHFQEEIMFFSSSHQRIVHHDRQRQGFTIILATLLVILALLLPAATAENVSGAGTNASLMASSIPAVTSITTTQPLVQNTTPVTTVPTTITIPVVKAPKIEFTVTPTEGSAPLAVTVFPVFNPAGGAPQYLIIDFGDGQQLNETLKTSYTHTYQVAGSYTITLTSVNAGGSNVETLQSPIIVHIPVPVPSSAPSTIPTTVPNTTVTVPVTAVATTVAVQNATALNTTFPIPVSSMDITIPLNNTPCFYPNLTSADFRATPVEGPAPLRVNFFDNSSCAPPLAWQWDFGSPVNPGIKTMRDPIVTYAEPGTYNVTLFVINSFNNNSSKTISGFIHVLPPVTPTPFPVTTTAPVPVPVIVPNFTANQTTGQAPLCVQFTDSSTGPAAVTWFWDFGDGSNATVKNPAHCYNNSGNYSVTLKTAPAGGAPLTKVRESYIIVSSGSAPLPMDILFVVGIVIVILVVVGIFVMKRNGGSHHAHTGGHHDETMKSESESAEPKGPRHGRDL
jgi:PKD repeat protein